jgi:hypothetical protein
MLSTRLPRFDGERVQALRVVLHVIASTETFNRQPDHPFGPNMLKTAR